MFINKTENGRNNLCGEQIAQLRQPSHYIELSKEYLK